MSRRGDIVAITNRASRRLAPAVPDSWLVAKIANPSRIREAFQASSPFSSAFQKWIHQLRTWHARCNSYLKERRPLGCGAAETSNGDLARLWINIKKNLRNG